jgi:hypothetical protein
MGEWQNSHRQRLVASKLESAWNNVVENFDGPDVGSQWSVKYDGTASGWKTRFDNGLLVIDDIEGKPGYATERLSRPTSLAGAFTAEFDFRWSDRDATYQGVDLSVPSLTLRKGTGTIVGSFGLRQGAQVYGHFVGSAVPLSHVNGLPTLVCRTWTAPLRPEPPGTPTATSGVPSRSKSELAGHVGAAEAGGVASSRPVTARPTPAAAAVMVAVPLRMITPSSEPDGGVSTSVRGGRLHG